MAHRQLSSLARRISRPLVYAPLHPRALQKPFDVPYPIAEDFCFNKLQSKFFSKSSSQRKGPGRITNVSENLGSPEKQSSSSQVLEDQSKSQGSSEKSSSNFFLILGAGTALVIGLFAFFPWDVLKSYYMGENRGSDLLVEDLKEKTSQKLPSSKGKQEADEKKSALDDLELLRAVEDKELANVAFQPEQETVGEKTNDTQNVVPLENSSNVTEYTKVTESVASSSPLSDGNVSVVEVEAKTTSEAGSKDANSEETLHSYESLSREVLSPTMLSNHSKDEEMLTSPKSQDSKSLSQKAEDYADNKESISMQIPSRRPMRRPNVLEAYYIGEVTNSSLQDNIQSKNGEGEILTNKLHIDGVQNVLDLLDVVHAAEKRQAELDAQLYKEAQKRLKHAFQLELKDAQAKEVMYAEEVSRLVKEIEVEKERAAAALELEQKMAREKLAEELKRKDEETNLKVKKAELLSRTEVSAAIAKEKLSYINDVRDVKQELEALYTVLFTQSKDFRQSHTIHKLAVGTFALEDAMKRGASLEKEVTLICSAYKDAGSDPLLDAIISSLPEHAVKKGTLTPHQLQEKFENVKKGVLELSMIPASGGGLLSHAAAKVISILKVKESGKFSDGVAAVVSQVQRCLADGKLVDAAELLEKGVHGTKAEVLVADWIENVRERAIMEQMLLLLQAHATAAASSLA